MSYLPVRNFESGSGVNSRDARALDRLVSRVNTSTAGDLVRIDAAGRKWEEILTVNTTLTNQAMRDTGALWRRQRRSARIWHHTPAIGWPIWPTSMLCTRVTSFL